MQKSNGVLDPGCSSNRISVLSDLMFYIGYAEFYRGYDEGLTNNWWFVYDAIRF